MRNGCLAHGKRRSRAENDARASRVVSEQSELTVQAPANAINGIATNSLRPSAALEHCYWPFHPYIFITSASAGFMAGLTPPPRKFIKFLAPGLHEKLSLHWA
ncbi:hypothetical protein L3X38_008109 [Prunus dulcis]|uniref:Uncharacterized protein n=1 Tax=Prunus dulcis TaxID=3755 RepID=A0AAD4ZVZ0_PRUDU|nr:hypothetical protein L3X38_008109 [Prunus dulcis]